MNRRTIIFIIVLMSLALIGIVWIQINWVSSSLNISKERFHTNAFAALNKVAERLQVIENDQALNYVNGYEANFLEQQATESVENNSENVDEFVVEHQYTLPDDQFSKQLIEENDCMCRKCQFGRWVKYNRIVNTNRLRNSYPLSERINLPDLDRILAEELHNVGISIPYNYGVIDQAQKQFIITDNHYVVGAQASGMFQLGGEDHLSKSKYQVQLFGIGQNYPGLLTLFFPNEITAIWGNIGLNVTLLTLLMMIIMAGFVYTVWVIFRQKKLGEMKNDFINNMTHEFKTPIATISLAADSINSPQISSDPAKVRRFVDIIKQENRRMHTQVEKVLQMAMIENRDMNLKFNSVNLHEIIEQAVTNINIQVEKKGGEIVMELAANESTIEADQTHISNIIYNLLDNANKYSPEHPHILVSTRDVEGGVEVTVKDNGVGISKEARRLIFDRFYRVPTGNIHDVKGFGLGLSYVKAMMMAHGGVVDVYSEPGKGSSFILLFKHRQSKSDNN